MNYILYDVSTGQVIGSGYCSVDDFFAQGDMGQAVLEGDADGRLQYVFGGVVIDRPALPEPVEGVWSDLPAGCTVDINGQTYALTDTSLALSIEIGGTFDVTVKPPFPYIEKSWRLEL
ncbi:hypothetical protein [Flexibacterium corallicola]|uniref:hypothetical protein n=1 Tax=Flexibacterium corallicola TaxID=3037259 RepID=UPI00286EC8CB|nr:hypothetical protein [Pseudovibrio sp. M1P-2-3]